MLKSINASRLSGININRHNQTTILIVDDNESFLKICQDMIESWGYNVITAKDGQEATTTFCKYKPDAVLMDLKMPKLEGDEAFRQMKNHNPLLKVFIMTAFAKDETRKKIEDEGVIEVLEKPFSLRELKRKIINNVGRGSTIPRN